MQKRILLNDGIELFYNHCNTNNATEFFVGLKTGSLDNGKNKGMAHLFEHMLFKGTKQHTATEISNIWHTRIRSLNAYTSRKHVMLHFYESNKRLEEGMGLVSEMLFDSIFPEDELKKEKDVIKQEIAIRKDKFESNLYWKLDALTFGRPDILDGENHSLGTEADIDRYTVKDLLRFQKENVCSNNIVIAISTKLSLHKVKKLLNKYFVGKAPENVKLKSFDERNMAQIGRPQSLIVTKDNKNKVFLVLFIKNNIKKDDIERGVSAGYLLSIVNGIGGKLLNKLREERGLVYQAQMDVMQTFQDGRVIFEASTSKENVNKTIDAICDVCKELLEEGINRENFEKLKEDNILIRDFEVNSPKGKSEAMINLYNRFGRLLTKKEKQAGIMKTTYDDVNNLLYEEFCSTNDVWFGAVGNLDKKDVYSHAKIKKMFDFRSYAKK